MNEIEIIASILKNELTSLAAISAEDFERYSGKVASKFLGECDFLSLSYSKMYKTDPDTVYRLSGGELCLYIKTVIKDNVYAYLYKRVLEEKMRVDKVAETLVRLYDVVDPAMGRNSTLWLGPPGN